MHLTQIALPLFEEDKIAAEFCDIHFQFCKDDEAKDEAA